MKKPALLWFGLAMTVASILTAQVDDVGPEARVLKAGDVVSAGGWNWAAQTNGVLFDAGTFHFKARTGDFASFDPGDGRKIRNEVTAMSRFSRGQTLTAEMDMTLKAPALPHKDLQWFAPVQIHQADTRKADGTSVMGSPLFALDVQPNKAGDGYDLQVRGETSTRMEGGFVNERVFARVPCTMGLKHRLKLEVIDMHGGPGGMVRVTWDGVVIVDQKDIATGWSYVESPVLLKNGKAQEDRSYLKLGIYAGSQRRPADVELENIISNLRVSVR